MTVEMICAVGTEASGGVATVWIEAVVLLLLLLYHIFVYIKLYKVSLDRLEHKVRKN